MAAIYDLVLVHIDNKPGFFARIEAIEPDVKPGWWQVRLLVLTMPLQVYTWTLDESQINGAPFTMGGTPIVMEKVVSPQRPADQPAAPAAGKDETKGAGKPSGAKVVSLADRKKGE